MNCLKYDTCKPGTSSTPILLATHVVPQIRLVAVNAR